MHKLETHNRGLVSNQTKKRQAARIETDKPRTTAISKTCKSVTGCPPVAQMNSAAIFQTTKSTFRFLNKPIKTLLIKLFEFLNFRLNLSSTSFDSILLALQARLHCATKSGAPSPFISSS
jgi:hypothetical protein